MGLFDIFAGGASSMPKPTAPLKLAKKTTPQVIDYYTKAFKSLDESPLSNRA